MEARTRILAIAVIFTVAACGEASTEQPGGTGGSNGSGGTSAGGGSSATGGSNTGGSSATGGSSSAGGATATGGISASGGTGSGGATGTGGRGLGGRTGGGGGTGPQGTGGGQPGEGGRTGSGGRTGNGGSTGNGGMVGLDGGAKDTAGPETGVGPETGSGAFAPCPASGDCKILPLGDSITWGIGYDGSYRVKLFANTITDKKNITYVGKMSNGPNTVSGETFPKSNEGHSGWTIQQIDDIVTGKSNDANYKGKKLIADLAPHIILLHIGTNDMYQTPSGADTRLGALIDKIVADVPDALLVVSNIIPFPQGASAVTTYNKAVPGVVEQRAKGGKHILFVDQFTGFPTSELGDGVHPNQQGYERMAGKWYAAIKSYLH